MVKRFWAAKKLFLAAMLVLVVTAAALLPRHAAAHIGGKSAVKVDGQYVNSNAFSAYYVTVPSDISLDTFTTKQTVSFTVDESIIQGSSGDYRWSWEDGKTFENGASAKHAFSKVGMHVANLQYKGTSSNTYDVIDTVGIAVVPFAAYKMPSIKVRVTPSKDAAQPYNLTFQATGAVDPSTKAAKYLWQFTDSKTAAGPSVTYNFGSLREVNNAIIAVTLFDGNGLKTNATIHPIMNSSGALDASVLQDNYRSAANTGNKSHTRLWIGDGILAVLLLTFIGLWFKKRRPAKKPKGAVIKNHTKKS